MRLHIGGTGGERAALVQVDINRTPDPAVEEEFHQLALSAGAQIIWAERYSRGEAEPRYYIGRGQAEALAAAVKAHDIELVIFNAPLSPSQERNLEKLCSARVLDRSGLVLDIFAQRARSHEGKLQVELAQLNHLATRLVRGWTHLERQKGGIGNYGRNVNQTAQRGVQGAYTGGKVTMAGTGAALGNAGGRIKGLLIK